MDLSQGITFESALKILQDHLSSWLETSIRFAPSLVVAILLFGFFWFLSKYVARRATHALEKRLGNSPLLSLSASLIRVTLVLLGAFYALGALNLSKTVTSLLAGAGVMGIALGFALQDIAANLFSGILIALRKPFRIGDIISVGSTSGTIQRIDLRATQLRSFEGLDVIIPNRKLVTEEVTNFTLTPDRLIEVAVGVDYGSDLDQVEKVTLRAVEQIRGRIESRAPEVYFSSFGDSSINLRVRFWIHYPADSNYFKCIHQCIKLIKAEYQANGINIPFPIRTIHQTK